MHQLFVYCAFEKYFGMFYLKFKMTSCTRISFIYTPNKYFLVQNVLDDINNKNNNHKKMSDAISIETGDNINNSSIDSTEDVNMTKGIEKCSISRTASTKNNSTGVNNDADTITNDDGKSVITSQNEHHVPTTNTSQQGDKLENTFKKKTRFKYD